VFGLFSSTTDANGVTFNQGFDWLGRLLARTNSFDSGKEFFGYSALGLSAYTNQLGEFTRYAYDAAGRKTNEVFCTAAGSPTHTNAYTYSPAGDLLTLKDPKGQTTSWGYDRYGRVTNKIDQAGTTILTNTYWPNGWLATRWSKAKGTTHYDYDANGNLTNVDYPVGTADLRYAYDALNRLTNMVDAVGTTAFTYDAAGNLKSEDGPWASDTVSYTYHSGVPRLRTGLSLAQPSGAWTNGYGYDAAGRLTNVTSLAGGFGYNAGRGRGGQFAGEEDRVAERCVYHQRL
jgi:YD repeat-containing protein